MNRRQAIKGRIIPALCIMTALLAACASQQPPPERRVNQTGYSAAFKQGYSDGCDSVQSSRRRNEQRYQSDADYMMGWNDGSSACRR